MADALDCGVSDRRIVVYASDRRLVVLTNDDDFLRPTCRRSVPVCYYSDDRLESSDIVELVVTLGHHVTDFEDLPPVTNLCSWD